MDRKKRDFGDFIILLGVMIIAFSIVFYFQIKQSEESEKQKIIAQKEEFKEKMANKKAQVLPDDWDVYNAHRSLVVDFGEEECDSCETEEFVPAPVVTEGAVGFVEIPKLDLILPLHPGTSNQSLNKGVGIMSEFDFPNQNRNSLSVIASHRGGRRGENTFLRIDKLQSGDLVKITTEAGDIDYLVSHSEIVTPTDWSKFYRNENKAVLVLLTCHPYPTNENRLLVFCEKVYEALEKPKDEKESQNEVKEENPVDDEDPNADQQEMNLTPPSENSEKNTGQ